MKKIKKNQISFFLEEAWIPANAYPSPSCSIYSNFILSNKYFSLIP